MNKRLLKTKEQQQDIFEEMSTLLSGLSSPVRVKLIHYLSQSPLSVEVLSEKIGQSVANTSMHLRKMYAASIVQVSVVGQRRLYQLDPAVLEFWEQAQDFFQKIHPNLDLNTTETYGDINWDDEAEMIRLLKARSALIIDVRPSDENTRNELDFECYKKSPSSELLKTNFPKNKTLFIFCRGRFCALSADSVFQLRQKGHKAFRLSYSWFKLQKILKGVEKC